MVLAIGYTLVQTLVFSRVLDQVTFSQTVAAAAVGLYLLPLNQSVARANFVLLRAQAVRREAPRHLPEAAAAFHLNQALLLVVSLAAPWFLGARAPRAYVALGGFLFYSVFTNIWVTEMQMALLATNRALVFEYVNTVRRLLTFALLALLMVERDFLQFALVASAMTLLFHIGGLAWMGGKERLFSWPRGLTRQDAGRHLGRLGISLQATASEWLTFNGPYAAFTLRFGIGPGLVAIDAVIKLVRVVVSVTRNLSEIALPRVSQAVLGGQAHRARGPVLLVLAGGGGGALVLCAAVLIDSHRVFSLLLGPNNTVPAGAGAPAAVAILSAVVFSTAGTLIGHTGRQSLVSGLLAASSVTTALFFGLLLGLRASVLGGFWLFALSLLLAAAAASWMILRLVGGSRAAPAGLSAALPDPVGE